MPTIKFICQRIPSLINSLGDKSRTPLHVAVLNGNRDAVKFYLSMGADARKRFLNIISD